MTIIKRSSEGLLSGWFFSELDYPPEVEIIHPAEVATREMLGHMSVTEIMALPVDDEE